MEGSEMMENQPQPPDAFLPHYIELDESPQLNELYAALAKAQGAMEAAEKDSLNPHFKSKFANLASVWKVCRKPLSDNGLAVLQRVSTGEGEVFITTQLGHSSGQWLRDRSSWPVLQNTPQAMGSAITYGRRYTLMSLVGVVADEVDDDAEGASVTSQGSRTPPERNARTTQIRQQLQGTQSAGTAFKPPPELSETWAAIKKLMTAHGKGDPDTAASFIKGATGKTDRNTLTMTDYDILAGILEGPAPKGEK